MRGRFVVFLMMAAVAWACEDPNTLAVSRVFSGNNLQTIYSDTFSVFTSTVQLDSFLTNNTNTLLLGKYKDDRLGYVSASSFFEISYSGSFVQSYLSFFDSAVLVLPYNHTSTGDTTKLMTINGYEIKEQMQLRKLPVGNVKISAFNNQNGLYSNSTFARAPVPIFSSTVKLFPHTDSLSIRLPDSFGRNWFRLAKDDSAHIFSNSNVFVNAFFYGLYLEADPSSEGCVAGFNVGQDRDPASKKTKLRFYYKRLVNNVLKQTHQDFTVYSSLFQYNNISYDRSGTTLASLQPSKGISSVLTNDVSYVQAGTGLVTRLDFPSVKTFFANQPNLILNAAYLIVNPEAGTYPKNLLPPKQLQLYATDDTNIPLAAIQGGSATISFDYQYGLNTQYSFNIFSYLFGQIKSGTNYITPLFLVPGTLGSGVQRLYLGDRIHPNTKIQLKIFYSYAQN